MRFRSVVVPILEVVLHTPAETVLAPYIERAPSPETKKWFATNFKNWLLKSAPENLHQLTYLPPNPTPQQEKALSFKDLWDIRLTPATETMIEHLLDYFQVKPNPPRLERMSVPDVAKAADDEIHAYNARVAKQGMDDDPQGVTSVMEFPGGYRMVEMTSQRALDREGNLMGHCIGNLHGCYLVNKSRRMFSLRDAHNEPHASIEVHSDDMRTTEIKGRRNMAPARRYWPMLRQFIEQYGVQVDNDHRNVGLLQIEDPETGKWETMTSDQFRDMVLDPSNERGQSFLNNVQSRHMEPDTALGLFNALYGTERLNDQLIQMVFSGSPDHAVQTVEHYGNKFTPEQLVVAFTSMRAGRMVEISGLYKALLIASKPDAATVNTIIEEMSPGEWRGRLQRRGGSAEEFVVALSQEMPDVYRQIIADPQAMERELAADNARAAGPFFALSGTSELTPLMVEQAFRYLPFDALKRMRRNKIMPDQVQFDAIIGGASTRYWGREEGDLRTFLDALLAYVKPDRALLGSAFEQTEKSTRQSTQEFAARLLMAAKKEVPDSIDKDVAERAVISIDREDMFRDFLKDEPNPSARIQQLMWQKAVTSNGRSNHLRFLQKIDPPIWAEILKSLTPEPIPTSKADHKYVKDKKTGNLRTVNIQRGLNDEEKVEARQRERREARRRFLNLLDPAVTQPGNDPDGVISPEDTKYQEGKAAFEALGKGKLFDAAIKRLNRQHLATRIAPGDRYQGGVDRALFTKHIDELTPKQIVNIIDRNRQDLFGTLVDAAPYRVPEIIGYNNKQYNRDSYGHYGKFDYPVEKDKALESLEAVWASTRVPDRIKDDYTVKVMKRFKPKPADLLRMLKTADSIDATRYILKKTKKPAPAMLRLVLENWPSLLLDVPQDVMPDDLLTDIMRDRWGLARRLMDRDLRAYGKLTQRKWETPTYRAAIGQQKEGDAYARYSNAAEAAGKQAEFARYVRQAELEELHPQLTSYNQQTRQHTVNMPLLMQHLDDYSIRSLVHVARGSKDDTVLKLYFERFSPKKLAALIKAGVFRPDDWRNDSKETKNLDPQKLRAALMVAMEAKAENTGSLIQQMVKDGFKFDDDLTLAVLQSDDAYNMSATKDMLMNQTTSPKVLHWIADNKPHNIDEIRHPDAYVVSKLFDHFGQIERGRDGEMSVDYWFTQAVVQWFSNGDIFFKYKPNPKVAKMLMDEAVRRRGAALVITRAMLQYIDQLRQRSGTDSYISTSGRVPIKMAPPGTKFKPK